MAQESASVKLDRVPELTCFACEREPTQQCARCGRPYCEDHGDDFCNVCLEPSSGVPSFTLYRGSLLALLIGAGIAVWVMLQPSGDIGESALRPVVVTSTSSAGATLTTPAPAGSPAGAATSAATVAGTPRPGTTTTTVAGATGTARPATTGTPAVTTTGVYVVVGGDTLSGICSDKIRRPGTMTASECVDQIKALNSLTSDNLTVGQQLRVPQ